MKSKSFENQINSSNKKAAIYARFSSDDQQEESITAQLRACYDFAEKNDYIVFAEYIDRAMSAKSDKRPEFQKAIKDSKSFDVLLVHKFDRFARNRYDHAVYGKKLNDNGAELIAVAENFGTGKEAILMEGLMQSLSEYYIKNLSEETKKGHKEKALQGLHNGGYPPFGYDVINQKYIINELEAIFVRKIFEACLNGSGYKELIEEMNNKGIRGKRGSQIRYSSMYDILRNEKYTGVYLYCQTESKDRNKRRSKENAIRIENAIPEIIEREKFERAQEIMNNNKNIGKSAKHDYLLSGIVKCSCGANMHAFTTNRKGNEYSYYSCSNKCGTKNIKESIVNKAVFDYLNELLTEDNKLSLYQSLQSYNHNIKEYKAVSDDEVKREIADREKEINNLMNNLSAAVLPPKVIENIGKKINELNEQIEVLNNEIVAIPEFSKNQVVQYLDVISEIEHKDYDFQYSTIQRFIKSVEIKETSIYVTSTFTEVLESLVAGAGFEPTTFGL